MFKKFENDIQKCPTILSGTVDLERWIVSFSKPGCYPARTVTCMFVLSLVVSVMRDFIGFKNVKTFHGDSPKPLRLLLCFRQDYYLYSVLLLSWSTSSFPHNVMTEIFHKAPELETKAKNNTVLWPEGIQTLLEKHPFTKLAPNGKPRQSWFQYYCHQVLSISTEFSDNNFATDFSLRMSDQSQGSLQNK